MKHKTDSIKICQRSWKFKRYEGDKGKSLYKTYITKLFPIDNKKTNIEIINKMPAT